MTTILTDANFDAQVLQTGQLTMVDFWATWCPPCVALTPTIDALAREYAGTVLVGKLNADENPRVCVEYGVVNLPCILFLHNGKVVDRLVGAAPKATYDKKLRKLLENTVK